MEESLEFLTKEINELWNEHLEAKFPEDFSGKDVNGSDLGLLDSNIAGCVSTFVENGNLNLYQTATLGLCYQRASFVLPILNQEGTEYFWRLERLSEMVLKAVAQKNLAEHLKD
jgi:hypothetical protein